MVESQLWHVAIGIVSGRRFRPEMKNGPRSMLARLPFRSPAAELSYFVNGRAPSVSSTTVVMQAP